MTIDEATAKLRMNHMWLNDSTFYPFTEFLAKLMVDGFTVDIHLMANKRSGAGRGHYPTQYTYVHVYVVPKNRKGMLPLLVELDGYQHFKVWRSDCPWTADKKAYDEVFQEVVNIKLGGKGMA